MYRAIFIDLDGTLLDDEKNVSSENINAIKKAEELGTNVIICSGRQLESIKDIKEKACINSKYVISSNGTEIYDLENKEVLFSSIISKKHCKILYDYVQSNDLIIRLDTKYGRYCNNMKYITSIELELNPNELNSFIENNDVTQISICAFSEETINSVITYVDSISNSGDLKIENKFNLVNNKYNLWVINIIRKNASKGNAMLGLCKFLKINIDEVIAVGDDKNDISMIDPAGLGIAMNNAIDEVKKVANYITKNNNNQSAIAEIINRYINNYKGE